METVFGRCTVYWMRNICNAVVFVHCWSYFIRIANAICQQYASVTGSESRRRVWYEKWKRTDVKRREGQWEAEEVERRRASGERWEDWESEKRGGMSETEKTPWQTNYKSKNRQRINGPRCKRMHFILAYAYAHARYHLFHDGNNKTQSTICIERGTFRMGSARL